MDPGFYNDWPGYKNNEPVEDVRIVGNIVRSWQWREHGTDRPNNPSNKTVLENMAEDILVQKPLEIRSCDLPGYPRSTFLMVFSPDGSKVASTHGNHNVYVSELASGKHVRILKGHPRTPWCIAFHPSHPQLIGSGCLGGQVRVWDIASGGSEVWNVRNETVIASIAFHPREQLLVIATHNELYFWDWSQSAPFTKVSTNNIKEKVRYVAFDALGYKLITGISVKPNASGGHNLLVQHNQTMGPTITNSTNRRDDNDDGASSSRTPDNPGSTQDMIVNSYQNLVQRYDSLVRNYQRLFRVRHRLVNTSTPPPPNTIDRGTDPMETDVSPGTSMWTRTPRPTPSTSQDNANPSSSRRQDSGDSGGESSSSRLLNLDVLSINSNPSRSEEPSLNQGHSIFGSRSSAFQPLSERRSMRTGDQNERVTRLLPNPFSSSSNSPRPMRSSSDGLHQFFRDIDNSSRTSIFTSSRTDSERTTFGQDFTRRRRNSSPSHATRTSPRSNYHSGSNNTSTPAARPFAGASLRSSPSTSGISQRPTMTNSSTQMSPMTGPVDAQSINESLDLIRDILRDSGTRLLNLITNMSLSTLASVERSMPRRPLSEDGEARPRPPLRPRVRLFSSSLRRDFLSSSSDSDSDRSLEVNIFRTRNSTFREDDAAEDDPNANESAPPENVHAATDRMVFELNNDSRNEGTLQDNNGPNVSVSRCRFRVRSQNDAEEGTSERGTAEASGSRPAEATSSRTAEAPGSRTAEATESRSQNSSDFNPNRPSTSRDNFWTRSPIVPPAEACRKVRGGVRALQKHAAQLTNMWLRGNRTTMRELRIMWENLRRRVVMLHRETGRQELPTYYTRTLIERCMMLSELSALNSGRNPRSAQRSEDSNRNADETRNASMDSGSTGTNNTTENEVNNSNDNSDIRRPQSRRSPSTRASPSFRISPSARRRLQASYRWRPEDELRRRSRNTATNRLTARYSRCRRDFARAIEISATRHEIRMRAMQVLSVMFNMMMMCLEEQGLSQLITDMLRTLKKALALTCLMLMTNRNNGRSPNNPAPPSQSVDSLNVVRIQNVEHTGPVNVDGPDDPPNVNNESEEVQKKNTDNKPPDDEKPSTSQSSVNDSGARDETVLPTSSIAAQRWSGRLAVQIAAANRNTSATARNRRDLYLECRRQKALHRTNPTAHPLIRKRTLPPVSTHRIPALRSLPRKVKVPGLMTPRPRPVSDDEPVAGPSTGPAEPPNRESSVMNEFEHRVNLIRIAHMQAVSIRNATRNRFRRLQTIRLYTPSSVREMFALQPNSPDNPPENRSPQNAPDLPRRTFTAYSPMNSRVEVNGQPTEEYHAVLNNVAMPLMQVNDQPATTENPGPQPQRFPPIHEYLQPIILAQNAMVVDVEGGGEAAGAGGMGGMGGMGAMGARRMGGIAGLLDAGIISEAQPVPSHRVQAWDFTTGSTPDIADSSRNVVVQRCKIHNDASIDISKDGRLLVALLPVPRFRNTNHWLGVYSLEWERLGQCLHTAVLEQSAVSVALSPTARHLAVGLGSRRITTTPHTRNNVFALLYKLEPLDNSNHTGLTPIKELEQNWEHSFTSLNCIRWAPQPGQGLVYANNTGQLIIMS